MIHLFAVSSMMSRVSLTVLMFAIAVPVWSCSSYASVTEDPESGADHNGATAEAIPPPAERAAVPVNRAEILEIFEGYNFNQAPGCAVAVFQDGKTMFGESFGMASLDYGIPVTDSTAFYMASVSKQMTAAAAGLLIVREQLDPDAPVAEYLCDWPEWANEVKVRHLFNHTSGLPDIFELMEIAGLSINDVMDLDDYLAVLKKAESLVFSPGSQNRFTNSGHLVLARLVETVSNTGFSTFADRELFKPLGMHNTHFHDDRSRIIPNRAISYKPHRNGFSQVYPGNFQGVGPGGLYSTLSDWQRWEAFWNGGSGWNGGLDEKEAVALKEMLTRQPEAGGRISDYGMAFETNTRKGIRIMGHNGSFMGFQADYRRIPELRLAMVVLCNRDDVDAMSVNRRLTGVFLKDHFEAYLKRFQGIYRNEELAAELSLEPDEGGLRLNRRLSPNGLLSEDAENIWSAGSSWEMVFERNESGQITGFKVSTGRAREVYFKRIQDLPPAGECKTMRESKPPQHNRSVR